MKTGSRMGVCRKSLLSLPLLLATLIVGASPARAAVIGERPLLVVLLEFRNQGFADGQYLENYQTRIFGPEEPNVTGYFLENSDGLFTYVPATEGDQYGEADGMVHVVMDVPVGEAPVKEEFRKQALALADVVFDYSAYDANGDGTIQEQELSVLVIQANRGGGAGKIMRVHNVSHDGVSLDGFPVSVISENVQNYTLYHELAHAVDYGGYTGKDLYTLRDGIRQKAILWTVEADGAISRAGDVAGEIALELEAAKLGASRAVSAYRDQNGELRLATFDLSSENDPQIQRTASAGLASDLSVTAVSSTRVVTALRSGSGSLKLIVWDVKAAGEFTRRGDYTAGAATDIEIAAVSSTRVVAAVRTQEGNLKLIAFDLSADGELTRPRRGSYTAGGATEMNLVSLSSTRMVTAVRQAGGDLKVIVFDLSRDGSFTRRADYHAGGATEIDLAKVSSTRVATLRPLKLGRAQGHSI